MLVHANGYLCLLHFISPLVEDPLSNGIHARTQVFWTMRTGNILHISIAISLSNSHLFGGAFGWVLLEVGAENKLDPFCLLGQFFQGGAVLCLFGDIECNKNLLLTYCNKYRNYKTITNHSREHELVVVVLNQLEGS